MLGWALVLRIDKGDNELYILRMPAGRIGEVSKTRRISRSRQTRGVHAPVNLQNKIRAGDYLSELRHRILALIYFQLGSLGKHSSTRMVDAAWPLKVRYLMFPELLISWGHLRNIRSNAWRSRLQARVYHVHLKAPRYLVNNRHLGPACQKNTSFGASAPLPNRISP